MHELHKTAARIMVAHTRDHFMELCEDWRDGAAKSRAWTATAGVLLAATGAIWGFGSNHNVPIRIALVLAMLAFGAGILFSLLALAVRELDVPMEGADVIKRVNEASNCKEVEEFQEALRELARDRAEAYANAAKRLHEVNLTNAKWNYGAQISMVCGVIILLVLASSMLFDGKMEDKRDCQHAPADHAKARADLRDRRHQTHIHIHHYN